MKKDITRAVVMSIISMFLCVAMLVGATYAWFTSSVTSGINVIRTKNFDVQVYYYESYIDASDSAWKPFDGSKIFDELTFMPGTEAVRYIKFVNNCDYDVKFDVVLPKMEDTGNELADDLVVYGATEVSSELTASGMTVISENLAALDATAGGADNSARMLSAIASPNSSKIVAVAFKLPESYNDPVGVPASFLLRVIATQYDTPHDDASATADGEDLTLTVGNVSVTVPGALAADTYTLTVTDNGEELIAGRTALNYDVTLKKNGAVVTEGGPYTVAISIGGGEGRTVDSVRHNGTALDSFTYDDATGVVSFTTTHFSPFTVYWKLAAWSGMADTSWYDAAETEFTLTTAEELQGLANIVASGVNFKNKTVKLGADIDLRNREWTPIGGSGKRFQGTFDGDGHTISNLFVGGSRNYGNGFFGDTLSGTVIKNVTFDSAFVQRYSENITVDDLYYSGNVYGVVVGYNYGSITFDNVHVTNSRLFGYGKVGALLGMAADPNGSVTITNCSVEGTTIGAVYNGAFFMGLAQLHVTVTMSGNTVVDSVWDAPKSQEYVDLTGQIASQTVDGEVQTVVANGVFWKYVSGEDVYYYAGWGDNYCDYEQGKDDFRFDDGSYFAHGNCH